MNNEAEQDLFKVEKLFLKYAEAYQLKDGSKEYGAARNAFCVAYRHAENSSPPSVEAGAVGWIWESHGQINFTAGEHHAEVLRDDGVTLRPVFTTPPASGEPKKTRTRLPEGTTRVVNAATGEVRAVRPVSAGGLDKEAVLDALHNCDHLDEVVEWITNGNFDLKQPCLSKTPENETQDNLSIKGDKQGGESSPVTAEPISWKPCNPACDQELGFGISNTCDCANAREAKGSAQ